VSPESGPTRDAAVGEVPTVVEGGQTCGEPLAITIAKGSHEEPARKLRRTERGSAGRGNEPARGA